MENVIALIVIDSKKGQAAFLTWGRLFHPTDNSRIESVVRSAVGKFGLTNVSTVAVCENLQEVASYPYFFEALLSFSWERVPFGKKYKSWLVRKRRAVSAGKEIYFIGIKKK